MSVVITESGSSKAYDYSASIKTVSLAGFHSGHARITGNITDIRGNNPVIRRIMAYINSNPGDDHNEAFKLSFYKGDGHVENELIWSDFFNLLYTEVKDEILTSSTSGNVDLTDGFVKGDKVGFLGVGAEIQAITGVTDSDTIAFTAVDNTHAIDSGVVRVYEFAKMLQLYDSDGSNEIHIALENVGAVLTDSTQILITLELQ